MCEVADTGNSYYGVLCAAESFTANFLNLLKLQRDQYQQDDPLLLAPQRQRGGRAEPFRATPPFGTAAARER